MSRRIAFAAGLTLLLAALAGWAALGSAPARLSPAPTASRFADDPLSRLDEGAAALPTPRRELRRARLACWLQRTPRACRYLDVVELAAARAGVD